MQLEIEREALKKEKDKASQGRLEKLEKELADLRESSNELTARWQTEKQAIAELRGLKEKLEQTRTRDGTRRARTPTWKRRPACATASCAQLESTSGRPRAR